MADEQPEAPQSIEERLTDRIFRQPEPEAKAPPQPEGDVDTVTVDEDAPEVDVTEGEEGEVAEGEATETPEEETVTVSSLAELMESVGADVDSMYDLTFPVTINGERQDIPLSEIKDSLRATKEAQRYQDEAKKAREEAKAFSAQAQESVKQQLAQAKAMADGLDAMYLAPFQSIDWSDLRVNDPAEYAAKRQEYVDTNNAVTAKKQSVIEEIHRYQQSAEAEQATLTQERLAQERQALYEKWPEMGDEKKGDAERSGLISFLKSDGFTDDEIGSAVDHRILLMARDAMRYRQQAQKVDATKKKVIKIGKKVLTPGAAQTKAQQAASRTDPMRQKLRKTGKIDDAAALLSQRFK